MPKLSFRALSPFVPAVLLALHLSPTPAVATTVSPVNVEMAAAGPKSRTQITVTNTGDDPIAIEPSAETLTVLQSGSTKTDPSEESFLILPTQALIQPGASQVFRVQYVGDPALPESQSFLITMTEIPVKGMSSNVGLQLLLSFGVAVNVAPTHGVAALQLVSTGIKKDKAGKERPFVVVENPTPNHALLRDADITVDTGSGAKRLAPGEIENALGTGLVQPGRRREFLLPVDVPANTHSVTASVKYPREAE